MHQKAWTKIFQRREGLEVQRSAELKVPMMCRPINHTHTCRSHRTPEEDHIGRLQTLEEAGTGYDQQSQLSTPGEGPQQVCTNAAVTHQVSDHDQVYTPTKPTHRLHTRRPNEASTQATHRRRPNEAHTQATHRRRPNEAHTQAFR